MANFFSNTIAADISGDFNTSFRPSGALVSGKSRKKIGRISLPTGAVINSTLVMGTLRSNDRIYDMRMSVRDAVATGTVSLGAYESAEDHVPVAANLVDADIFASATSVATAVNRVDVFAEGGGLAGWHRGMFLWELLAVGDGTYTEDPQKDIDLVFLCASAIVGACGISLEVDFVSSH